MKTKVKYYQVYGCAVDKDGNRHMVTVVGKFEQARMWTTITQEQNVEIKPKGFVKGELSFPVKMLYRKLTLGMAICHPSDTFDEDYGVKVAKGRIERNETIGSLYTNDVTMLTEDAIKGELFVKLQYIMDNIEEYIY